MTPTVTSFTLTVNACRHAADLLPRGGRDGGLLRRRSADRESQRHCGARRGHVLSRRSEPHRRGAQPSRTLGAAIECRLVSGARGRGGLGAGAIRRRSAARRRTHAVLGAGSYGGHTETAVSRLAPQWYFAEGAEGYFSTFLLVANPLGAPADVTLTFLREGESPVTTTLQVAPFSRTTIPASSLPDLANRAFGIIVEATQPVMAERAMYFGTTADPAVDRRRGGSRRDRALSTWYFAEGATGAFFDTFILLMNPDVSNDAHVTLRYLLDSGETIDVPKVVPARGRLTVSIESESDPRLQTAAMSVQITADRPIVAERSVYWQAAEGAPGWSESHSSQGATVAGPRWALAEGRSRRCAELPHLRAAGEPGCAGRDRERGVPAGLGRRRS